MKLKKKISVLITVILIMSMIPQTVLAAEAVEDELTLSEEVSVPGTDLMADDEGSGDEATVETGSEAVNETSGGLDGIEPASGYTVDDFVYDINEEGVTITGLKEGVDDTGILVLPGTIEGKPVIAIGEGAFEDKHFSGKLVIPGTVKDIGRRAFSGCSSITSLSLPEGLEKLGDYAFSSCAAITGKLIIPKSITEFGDSVFEESLTGVTLVLTKGLKTVGRSAFYNAGLVGEITIPASMTEINDNAFGMCCGITSVKIGKNIKTIGSKAFSKCTGLKGTLTIPDSVDAIMDEAFFECSGITKLSLSKNLTYLEPWSFGGCIGVTELTIPGKLKRINGSPFHGMYFMKKVVNNSNCEIVAKGFIDNSRGGESYFVKNGTKKKIKEDGVLKKGTYIHKVEKLGRPEIGSNNTEKGVELTCNKVFGAKKYVWERRKDGIYKFETVGKTSKPVFTDTKAKEGTRYYYRVYVTEGKKKGDASEETDIYRMKNPKLKTLKNSAKGKMKLTWTKSDKADGYIIGYSENEDFSDPEEVVINRKKTTSKEIKVEKGKTYYVAVVAYKQVYNMTYYSWSNIKKITIKK